jgi:hypothetical protein
VEYVVISIAYPAPDTLLGTFMVRCNCSSAARRHNLEGVIGIKRRIRVEGLQVIEFALLSRTE